MKNVFLSIICILSVQLHAITVEKLRCEYTSNPIGIDFQQPRLSWQLNSSIRADKQTSYQIIVSSSTENLEKGIGDLWDTGLVNSDQSIQVQYDGKPLTSMKKYSWKVRVSDKDNHFSEWSAPANWSMGILNKEDWKAAKWIAYKDAKLWRTEWNAHKECELAEFENNKARISTWPWFTGRDSSIFALYEMAKPSYDPSPLFRKEFNVSKTVSSAFLYICGLGYYEAYINGEKVGDHVLDPAWTNYDKRSMYVSHDVSNQISSGGNAIGIMLGRGQYNPLCNDVWKLYKSAWVDQPKVCALLHIEYTDGSSSDIFTDNTWKTAGGPILYDDTRHGELYDARLEQEGWSLPTFDEKSWKSVSEVSWNVPLVAQIIPPIRCFNPIKVVKTIQKSEGIVVYDIGQNIAGWARVEVSGNAGDRVLVEYCETPTDIDLVPNNTPWRFNHSIKDPFYASFYDKGIIVRQQNGYILKGKGKEIFECHFSYKGFQYIRVSSFDGARIEKVVGVPVHTDIENIGKFECSNPVVNQLQKMSVNTLLNNFHSVSTDCPHREKQGWTADIYMSSQAAMYNFNMATFYSKWVQDLAGTEDENGFLATVAPSSNIDSKGSTVWPAAMVILPLQLYYFYNDKKPLAQNIDLMHRFAKASMQNQIEGKPEIIKDVLGDWVAPLMELNDTARCNTMAPPEGTSVYGTASHFLIVKLIASIERILGNNQISNEMDEWAKRIKTQFNAVFYDKKSSIYHGERPTKYRQSPNIVALQYGLVEKENQESVLLNLTNDLHKYNDRIGTGFIGTAALMNFLPNVNPELAFKVATQEKYPGWGFMVEQGANTMWETWDGYSSRNHPPFCLISEYFYKHLAGIQNDTASPGFKHFFIHPSIVGDLTYVNADFESQFGNIKSNWKLEHRKLFLNLSIPVNTSATIYIKTKPNTQILESGKAANLAHGVRFIGNLNDEAIFNLQSGNYSFQSEIK